MKEEIFVISPKRVYREQLMPQLVQLLEAVQGVRVIGYGSTSVKIGVQSAPEFEKQLTKDITERCFIERAGQFVLAK